MTDIEIHGHTLTVFIDTGASKSVFGLETVKRVFNLSDSNLHQNEKSAIGIDHHGIGKELVILDEFEMGEIKLLQTPAISFDFQNINETYSLFNIPAIDGILGGDILKMLGAVIDYEHLELRLSEKQNINNTMDWKKSKKNFGSMEFDFTFVSLNTNAEVAQLVEHDLAKVGVAGPSPVFRSKSRKAGIFF